MLTPLNSTEPGHDGRRRAEQPGDREEQGRLATAGFPDDADELPAADPQADAVDRTDGLVAGAVVDDQGVDVEQEFGHDFCDLRCRRGGRRAGLLTSSNA